jgi:hypothetical protein
MVPVTRTAFWRGCVAKGHAMTRLAVVPAAAPAPALSDARTALVDQLARIGQAQEAYNALRRTGDRMRTVDPAASSGEDADETGIIVAGIAEDHG